MDLTLCCFCKKDVGPYGNNPFPVAEEGLCCDSCNISIVVKARLDHLNSEDTVCMCRACMLKAYVHLDVLPTTTEQESQTTCSEDMPLCYLTTLTQEEQEVLHAEQAYHQRVLESTMTDPHEPECSICFDTISDHRKCQGLVPYDCSVCEDYHTDHSICK